MKTSTGKDYEESLQGDDDAESTLSIPASECCPGCHSSPRPIAVYCRDCDTVMCESCFIHLHNGHGYARVDDVVDEMRGKCREDEQKLANIALEYAERLNVLEVSSRVLRFMLLLQDR